jgi:peptidoglycan biosynthesis protein MviN/MurJ (putative lipid II flippase)
MLLLGAFGSVVSGAYAIASQVAGYQLNLSSAIGKAAQPAVTQATGRGDRDAVRRLIPSINKFAALLALFYLVPLIIETEAALNLWLSRRDAGAAPFPPETATFVRLTLLVMGLPWVYSGYHAAIFADGRIRGYMISAVVIEAIGMAGAVTAVFAFGAPAWAVPAFALGTAAFAMVFWVLHISRVLEIPRRDWLIHTWGPLLLAAAPAALVALGVSWILPAATGPFFRLAGVTTGYAIVAIPFIWLVAVGPNEKPHLKRLIAAAGAKLRVRAGGQGPADDAVPPAPEATQAS